MNWTTPHTPTDKEVALQAQRERGTKDCESNLPFGTSSRPFVAGRTEIDADLDRAYRTAWQAALDRFRQKQGA